MAVFTGNGTVTAPSFTFSSDTNTGIYRVGEDQLAITTNGVQRLLASTTAVASTLPVSVPVGAEATPSLTFAGDLDTGIWRPAADTISMSTNAGERVRLGGTGDIFFGGDVSGGNSRYRYVQSANRHQINTAAGVVPAGGQGDVRLSIRGGGIRIQSEGGNGVGSWVINNFSLEASEADKPVMSLSTSYPNLSRAESNAIILLSIHAGWPGAANNSARIFYGYIRQIQNGFSVTTEVNSFSGADNSWTLTTARSAGTQTLRLTNNSGTFPMVGSISMLLLGGTAPTYALNAL